MSSNTYKKDKTKECQSCQNLSPSQPIYESSSPLKSYESCSKLYNKSNEVPNSYNDVHYSTTFLQLMEALPPLSELKNKDWSTKEVEESKDEIIKFDENQRKNQDSKPISFENEEKDKLKCVYNDQLSNVEKDNEKKCLSLINMEELERMNNICANNDYETTDISDEIITLQNLENKLITNKIDEFDVSSNNTSSTLFPPINVYRNNMENTNTTVYDEKKSNKLKLSWYLIIMTKY